MLSSSYVGTTFVAKKPCNSCQQKHSLETQNGQPSSIFMGIMFCGAIRNVINKVCHIQYINTYTYKEYMYVYPYIQKCACVYMYTHTRIYILFRNERRRPPTWYKPRCIKLLRRAPNLDTGRWRSSGRGLKRCMRRSELWSNLAAGG